MANCTNSISTMESTCQRCFQSSLKIVKFLAVPFTSRQVHQVGCSTNFWLFQLVSKFNPIEFRKLSSKPTLINWIFGNFQSDLINQMALTRSVIWKFNIRRCVRPHRKPTWKTLYDWHGWSARIPKEPKSPRADVPTGPCSNSMFQLDRISIRFHLINHFEMFADFFPFRTNDLRCLRSNDKN